MGPGSWDRVHTKVVTSIKQPLIHLKKREQIEREDREMGHNGILSETEESNIRGRLKRGLEKPVSASTLPTPTHLKVKERKIV